jgi:carboxymethylenebutenolidase
MISQTVTIPVEGQSMPAYLARPEPGSGAHSAVIVLPEVFGLNVEMQRVADMVAGAGGVALAINVFHRVDPNFNAPYDDDGAAKGMDAAKKLSRATLRADVAAAIAWLDQQEFVKTGEVATWGFCLGGAAAFVTASVPAVRGAVCFYGGQIARPFPSGEPEGLDDASAVACPLLLVFGGDDAGIPPQAIERIRASLAAAGKDFQIQVYPGVGHGFFRHGTPEAIAQHRDSSDEALAQAVADAWHLTLAFFKRIFPD